MIDTALLWEKVHEQGRAISALEKRIGARGMDLHEAQLRVTQWGYDTFGPEIVLNKDERFLRFLEEAIELAQAGDMDREQAHRLVDYVYDRPPGETIKEAGGVMVTLLLLAHQDGFIAQFALDAEIARIHKEQNKIRLRHQEKQGEGVGYGG